jgi:hypothetical protein
MPVQEVANRHSKVVQEVAKGTLVENSISSATNEVPVINYRTISSNTIASAIKTPVLDSNNNEIKDIKPTPAPRDPAMENPTKPMPVIISTDYVPNTSSDKKQNLKNLKPLEKVKSSENIAKPAVRKADEIKEVKQEERKESKPDVEPVLADNLSKMAERKKADEAKRVATAAPHRLNTQGLKYETIKIVQI